MNCRARPKHQSAAVNLQAATIHLPRPRPPPSRARASRRDIRRIVLDPARRAALYDALTNLGAQVFMTGADPAAFGDIVGRAQTFLVRPGTIELRN